MANRIIVLSLVLVLVLAACAPLGYDPFAVTATPTLELSIVVDKPMTASPTPRTCTVTASSALNLRAGAGVNNSVIAWLKAGDVLTLTNTQPKGAWIEVTFEDRTGWINSNYCKGK